MSNELSTLATEYLRERVATRTLDPMSAKNHRSTLHRFSQFYRQPLDQLNARDIEAWQAATAHLRPATRRAQHSTVKTFCTWLVRRGHLASNPVLEVPSPRQPRSVPRALESDAVSALLNVCPDLRAKAIVWLMVGMGLRCCEVSRLRLERWDRRAEVMVVRGKGSNERALPVPVEVTEALSAYLTEYPIFTGAVIRSYRQPLQALSADALSGMVSEWMRAADVKGLARDGVSAHALRATAASDVLDICGDLRVVQEMLGHQSLATTSIYLRRAGLRQMRPAMAGRRYEHPEAEPA